MSQTPSQCEDIRHTVTHHFQSFTVCCTTVNSIVSIILLRVYFWNHVFNIFIQGTFRVTQEWCSWTSAHALTTHVTLMFSKSSLPSRVFRKWAFQDPHTAHIYIYFFFAFSHWQDPLSPYGCLSRSVWPFLVWVQHIIPSPTSRRNIVTPDALKVYTHCPPGEGRQAHYLPSHSIFFS